MIKYDNKYYDNIVNKYNYELVDNLPKENFGINSKWYCSYNLKPFFDGISTNKKQLVIMGIGINGVPHIGTVSQMLKAIYLQKQGFNVQIILGDLDVYGARAKSLKDINRLIIKYKKFLVKLGFDETKGKIRNQYDYPEIIRTSFLLSSCIKDRDFEEIEEDINDLYKTERVYTGMDPSAPDIHLGHAVALRKIKQLQDLGHTAVVIIGDFTGAIGDPTGKSKTRNQLTDEQVKYNAQTYLEQIFKVIDKDKTELHYNSEWFANMSFKDVINLFSKTTVARMLERDDFNNRMNNHKPIAIHEFFYPLMQAYDSVEVKSDLELGGTDQTFNVMMGRNIQKNFGVAQQVPVFIPLLVGLDGKEKMSKSLGNYIGVNEDAKTMYTKVMKVPDDLIVTYYELTTDIHPDKVKDIKKLLEKGEVNPRDIKMHLARSIVSLYHTEEELKEAEANFQAIFQKKDIDVELPELVYDSNLIDGEGLYPLIDCIFSTGKYKSKSEVRRLIQQGAVKLNGEKTSKFSFVPEEGMVIQVGKGNVFKLKEQEKNKTLTKIL